ncbi:hypothetical protein KGF57_000719 [Candida theae]|uniref:Endonuclease/exonuclease/phosphatase domain-containing protein n=1 Tax=Candida theae TaxID=1198502 RepID=A0AAD5BI89_9ASCO|nr:uncharacterized protein KGF57_000719 [Candida theae]KAI5965453.1 hypothetical protein KGF57_000719 [Candida theae]
MTCSYRAFDEYAEIDNNVRTQVTESLSKLWFRTGPFKLSICLLFFSVLMILVPRSLHITKIISFSPVRSLSYTTMNFNNYDAMKYRQWVALDRDEPPANDSSKLSIMTYNLLSRHYIWKNVYDKVDKLHLDWERHRFPLINKTIEQFSCDIMCFQEMEYYIYKTFWGEQFPSYKYKSFYIQKQCPSNLNFFKNEKLDGVGIFVNTERFDVMEQLKINYGEEVLKQRSKYKLTSDWLQRVIARNTVALILKLYDKRTDKIYYVSNTHLYWSPDYNDVKVLQIKILLNKLQQFRKEHDSSIILLGDLNSNFDSDVVNLLSGRTIDTLSSPTFKHRKYGVNNPLIDPDGRINNPFNLRNVYQSLHSSNNLPFTSYVTRFADVLDHVFVSDDVSVDKLLGQVDPVYCNSDDVTGFPNSQFPSDHIPLVVEVSHK